MHFKYWYHPTFQALVLGLSGRLKQPFIHSQSEANGRQEWTRGCRCLNSCMHSHQVGFLNSALTTGGWSDGNGDRGISANVMPVCPTPAGCAAAEEVWFCWTGEYEAVDCKTTLLHRKRYCDLLEDQGNFHCIMKSSFLHHFTSIKEIGFRQPGHWLSHCLCLLVFLL